MSHHLQIRIDNKKTTTILAIPWSIIEREGIYRYPLFDGGTLTIKYEEDP